MRTPRLKVAPEGCPACYHCVSRTVEGRSLDPEEKDHFLRLLHESAQFCRIRLLTFCIMSDHFHLLVEVPQKPETTLLPSPEDILADLRRLSGFQFPDTVEERFEAYRQARDAEGLAAYLATFHARMYDVSVFLKLLKQRFTQGFNARHQRRGTLWEQRFKSVLVEGMGDALAIMAAYIDLNPVRAGLVQDPKEYRWSGYGEAMAGRKATKQGLQVVVKGWQRGREENLARSLEVYRRLLYLENEEQQESIEPDGQAHSEARRGKEKVPLHAYLRRRVRYFSDGMVVGSREFVEGVFGKNRDLFGKKRKSGARVMRELEGGELFTMRNLQVRVFDKE
jgi:REP element-mobilizing transposase RayT